MKKTQITSGLRGGTALSALVLASALFAAPAFAQDTSTTTTTQTAPAADDAATDDGAIVVTGSLFRRTNSETPSPVTVLSAATLEQRGINTVAEAVQRVSAGGAGNITQGWNTGSNFATGANAVSLRGLTVQSTLTIFDGLRMAPYPLADDGHRNFVDLNTIPNAIVERIEVLRDGASSTYGADAVAGVINVITKKQITGLHANVSAGISQQGDAAEQRIDLTWGYGDLDEQGFNFYINGEYQRQDALYARDRKYPFGTADLSRICNAAGSCMFNNVQNSYTNGRWNGLFATQVPVARAVDATGAAIPGSTAFTLLNPAAGCRELTPVNVPAAVSATAGGTVQCSRDARAMYSQLFPEQERLGFAGRFTANIGDRAQFYASANYYQVRTETQGTPSPMSGNLPPPNPAGFLQPSNLYLPVYVCGTGVGNRLMTGTGCTAANGVLNPQNPYAAAGNRAQVLSSYDQPRYIQSKSRSLRAAAGINGSFADDWNYSVEATVSQVQLDINQYNQIIPQRLWNAVARGEWNFLNPAANTQATRDYVAPLNSTRSFSDLWQVSGTLSKDLFQLPGGPLQAAVGGSYRHESINNPSANAENLTSPYDRYFVANAVGAVGSRNVKSAFFEINAPIIPQLEINASGRYDDYSSGQSNFSPKIGAKFTPIKQLAIRGTYSKGFRIPSFNESFGLPTTGYVTYTLNPAVPAEAAFIAAHGGNAYATGSFPVGLTSTGNPSLAPEKSTSWTVGGIFEPIRNVSFTVDYWNIEVKDIIGGADYSDVRRQYYTNNGVVNVPGITVVPGTPDVAFPAALPQLGFIQYSFENNDSQRVSGIDLGANVRLPLGGDITLTSAFEAAYLLKFEKSIGGTVQRYDGTLSPCDVTSCSGAPKWRGSWQNTVEIGGFTGSLTAYYTSGLDLASIDYGGIKGNCTASIGSSVSTYADGTPVLCKTKAQWNADLALSYRINDRFTVYTNVLNVFGIDPVFDPSAAYHIFQFNPSWSGPNILGRYFRVGARVKF
ncbi:MAG: TonB-dependent receptor [Sphingomonas sp.]|uniref:TonB-dependent receptor domain-containing protein n=1 Tax=Sphingomonas sp. TaxID=28214 RepID=UPI0025FECD2F|nr:TonB-dependent receptor [Sphingomonas sp.]MBX3563305.1 TonB-dependent receptor [Sphingomonas sp.]